MRERVAGWDVAGNAGIGRLHARSGHPGLVPGLGHVNQAIATCGRAQANARGGIDWRDEGGAGNDVSGMAPVEWASMTRLGGPPGTVAIEVARLDGRLTARHPMP